MGTVDAKWQPLATSGGKLWLQQWQHQEAQAWRSQEAGLLRRASEMPIQKPATLLPSSPVTGKRVFQLQHSVTPPLLTTGATWQSHAAGNFAAAKPRPLRLGETPLRNEGVLDGAELTVSFRRGIQSARCPFLRTPFLPPSSLPPLSPGNQF